jgi:hypothetical protein
MDVDILQLSSSRYIPKNQQAGNHEFSGLIRGTFVALASVGLKKEFEQQHLSHHNHWRQDEEPGYILLFIC